MNGVFLTLEGGEGAGKTTQAVLLAERIRGAGRAVILTREPGDTPLGAGLRRMLVEDSADPPCAWAELFLYAADRAQHVERVIRPALERGEVVVCDRFADATEAYQGWGRGLPLEAVRSVNRMATAGLAPHRTVLLDLPPGQGLSRALGRSQGASEIRFEREALAFHERVRRGYLEIARREPARVRVVDGAGPPEAVAERVWAVVRDLFESG